MTARELLLACLLDLLAGDPRWFPHPVRLMGRAAACYERGARAMVRGPVGERIAGVVLALGLPLLAYAVGRALIGAAGLVHQVAGSAAAVLLAWTTLAARDLSDHAAAVQRAIEAGSLEEARRAVGLIVGRDTDGLSAQEIARAAVESVAESASDGVVAPLCYLVIGGPPLALAYKAVSTLDSLVGHHEPPYTHFGWASARLDDLANWAPARLTALLLVLAAWLLSRESASMRRAWAVLRRDGRKHASPNSGRPEAAMAGALGVRLGGPNRYGGILVERPTMGDPVTPLGPAELARALRLMWIATGLAVVLAVWRLPW